MYLVTFIRGVEKLSGKTKGGEYSGISVLTHDPRKDRTLSWIYEKYLQTSELLLPYVPGIPERVFLDNGLDFFRKGVG